GLIQGANAVVDHRTAQSYRLIGERTVHKKGLCHWCSFEPGPLLTVYSSNVQGSAAPRIGRVNVQLIIHVLCKLWLLLCQCCSTYPQKYCTGRYADGIFYCFHFLVHLMCLSFQVEVPLECFSRNAIG